MIHPEISERALVLAPRGRDAAIASGMLAEAGIEAIACGSAAILAEQLAGGAGFVLVTEEALVTADLKPLAGWISAQEEWSDLPFILLTTRGGGLERNPAAARYLGLLGNVTFLERPFHPTTLVSLAQSALRGRRRQYEARARLKELRELTASLGERVTAAMTEREMALAQLHEAQKLETLGHLTGGVAHDFNNLLTPITGALDLMNRRFGNDDPRAARLIGGAIESAERARTLVQRLLGFARRQALHTRPVDIAALLDGMRDLIVSSIGSSIELRIMGDDGLPAAMADPNQLELAVLNLCVNARDAMPGGGMLTIEAKTATLQRDDVPSVPAGAYLQLSVTDTGVGMDEATLARAVEPFYSTKEIGKGTGLGLSMVHGLASQLGGGFQLTSAPGQGTRADLWLPTALEAAAAPRQAPADMVASDGRPLSILLVDDEPLVRVATAEMLREVGHSVVEATSATDALLKLRALALDIVITDYTMPQMNGAELAERIRSSRPELPVLLITGYTGPAEDAPDLPRLDKPFRRAELVRAVEDLLEGTRAQIPHAGAGPAEPTHLAH